MAYAFSELIDYIKSQRESGNVLSMGELHNLYMSRLTSLGFTDFHVHRTRFRQDILAFIPDLVEVKDKRTGHYDLVFDDDLAAAIAEYNANTTEDMLILAKAFKILRNEALDQKQDFNGTFNKSSAAESVGQKRLSFMTRTLYGPGIHKNMESSYQNKENTNSVPLSLSQLTSYNMVKRCSTNPTAIPCHMQVDNQMFAHCANIAHQRTT